MRIISFVFIAVVSFCVAACTKNNEEQSVKQKTEKARLRNSNILKKPFHGEMGATTKVAFSPLIESVKNNHLEQSSSVTIGEVFEKYKHAEKIEWREAVSNTGASFVDYICWIDVKPFSSVSINDGVVKRALDVKFVIRATGETYVGSASRIDIKSDGMIYTTEVDPTNLKRIVDAIYENREIPF